MPISCLHGIDRNAIGTFSKVLFPSLPLGYLVIPSELVERFRAGRVAMDISPTIFSQAVLADFIREGSLFTAHSKNALTLPGTTERVG